MAQAVLVSARPGTPAPCSAAEFAAMLRRLSPDIIRPNPSVIMEPEGAMIGIVNPTTALPMRGGSVCLGALFGPKDDWDAPGADAPDGAYALFRTDADSIELLTDAFASRTIWFAQTPDLFVASTLQRAVVALLRSFEPNPEVIPWVLSAGTLGYQKSWDRRVRMLGGEGRVRLDRRTWTASVTERPVSFASADLPETEHKANVLRALEDTFAHVQIDPERWVMLLSGGFDSRCILLLLIQNGIRPRCITWGLEASQNLEGNDAVVAQALARHFGLEHSYHVTEVSDEPGEAVLDRYVRACEGRFDSFEAYLDGFRIWRSFFEDGCAGVIRGDEAFGEIACLTPTDVRTNDFAGLLSDFSNIGTTGALGLGPQAWPEELEQQPGETLDTWRDRVFHQYTMPVVYGGLNGIKTHYVEIINPLCSRRIAEEIRRLPDDLRTAKGLFKSIVRSISPDIPFATENAVMHPVAAMNRPALVQAMRDELASARAASLLPPALLKRLLKADGTPEMGSAPSIPPLKRLAQGLIPNRVRRLLRSTVMKAPVNMNVLRFRAFTICRMHKVLSEDARMLRSR